MRYLIMLNSAQDEVLTDQREWNERIERLRNLHETHMSMTMGVGSDYDNGKHVGFVKGLGTALRIMEGKEKE